MSKTDRDLLISCFVLALAVFSFYVSAAMETPRELIESPGVFPGLMSIILFIFGVVYFMRSIRRGGENQTDRSWPALLSHSSSRRKPDPSFWVFLFPAIYVFIAIPLDRLLHLKRPVYGVMFYLYVKRWRRWILLPVSIGITVTLYLVFTVFFQLQIW